MAAKGFSKFIIVITTITAAVMELIDTSIVNVALNDMAGSLGVSIEDVSWVITAYAIANVIIIPLTGFLSEYFGRKNYYLVSMIIFTIASYMCAESTSLVQIVIWRFVQGVGGGALLSTSQAILFSAFDKKDQPVAAGIFGMGLVLGPTLGPTLGGYIIEHGSWPEIFMINIPIGIIASILTFFFIEKEPNEGKNKKNIYIDYPGIGLLAAGIGCLQYVLERGESEDWFSSPSIRICSVIAAVGLIGFVWRQLTMKKKPAVNLKVLGNKNLALTTVLTFVSGFGLYTSVFVYPVFAQRVVGFTAYYTGLALLAPTLLGVMLMPIVGKLMSKGAPAQPFVFAGFLFFSAYCWSTSRLGPDLNIMDFFIPLALRAFGMAFINLPLINQAVVGLAPKDYAAGIALNNMIRQLGGAFGIAVANIFIRKEYMQHRSDILSHIPADSPSFMDRIHQYTQAFISKGSDAASALQRAYKVIDLSVDKQAYYLAYMDTFRVIALFFVCVIPLIFFLKRRKGQQAKTSDDVSLSAH